MNSLSRYRCTLTVYPAWRHVSAIVLLLAVATESHAADKFWDSQIGGTFSNPLNWQGGSVPGESDVARFGLSGAGSQLAYNVLFFAGTTNETLVVEDDDVSFDLSGQVYQLTHATSAVEIGAIAGRSAGFTITDGSVRTTGSDASVNVAAVPGSSGFLTLANAGSLVRASGNLTVRIGRFGAGVLTIQNSGLGNANVELGSEAGADGVVTVSGAGAKISPIDLTVGSFGTGALTIAEGGLVTSENAYLGRRVTGRGTVNVDGPGSKWVDSRTLNVGDAGSGTLNITRSGTVQATGPFEMSVARQFGSRGAVIVDGVDSELTVTSNLAIGYGGAGSLRITGGGKVQNLSGRIALLTTSSGEVLVDGPNSQWINTQQLEIGTARATGSLQIRNGGYVENTNGLVGAAGTLAVTQTVIVDGPGSEWRNTGELTIGSFSPATLTISNGAVVRSTAGYVGKNNLGQGAITVDGANSRWINTGRLLLGQVGAAAIEVKNGGALVCTDGILGSTGPATVVLSDTGSSWMMNGLLSIGGLQNPTLEIQTGALASVAEVAYVENGGRLQLAGGTFDADAMVIGQTGVFEWSFGALHVGTFNGNLAVPNGGTLAPGRLANAIGRTKVEGDYAHQAGATLQIELAPTGHDDVQVAQHVTLGGNLQVDLLGGLTPNAAAQFVVLDSVGQSSTLSGEFENVANGRRLATADGFGSFVVNYGAASAFDPKQVVLSNFQLSNADFDDNGHVDNADRAKWDLGFGLASGSLRRRGDADGDGDSDGGDFLAWQRQLGGIPPQAAVAAIVPEPGSTTILFTAIAAGALRRHRTKYTCCYT